MLQIARLPFNPFETNCYIVYIEEGSDCLIFDASCHNASEQKKLQTFISGKNLRPTRLINTHCHIDHVFGNAFAHRTWGLLPELHPEELNLLNEETPRIAHLYNLPYEPSPQPALPYLNEGDKVQLGSFVFEILHTPGHSPGSLTFYCAQAQTLISGDVLFHESIGRTDFPPYGSMEKLTHSIKNKLYTLDDKVIVYPGHGQPTNIGHEKKYNPFVRG